MQTPRKGSTCITVRLFEQTPEAIMLVDLQDRVLRVNREFTNIFGYRIDEIIGSASTDLITPPQLRPDALTRRKRLAEGQHVSLETVCLRKDGSQLNVSEVSFPVMTGGKCIAHYVIFRDITVKVHRRRLMQKMQATSFADLLRMCSALKIPYTKP